MSQSSDTFSTPPRSIPCDSNGAPVSTFVRNDQVECLPSRLNFADDSVEFPDFSDTTTGVACNARLRGPYPQELDLEGLDISSEDGHSDSGHSDYCKVYRSGIISKRNLHGEETFDLPDRFDLSSCDSLSDTSTDLEILQDTDNEHEGDLPFEDKPIVPCLHDLLMKEVEDGVRKPFVGDELQNDPREALYILYRKGVPRRKPGPSNQWGVGGRVRDKSFIAKNEDYAQNAWRTLTVILVFFFFYHPDLIRFSLPSSLYCRNANIFAPTFTLIRSVRGKIFSRPASCKCAFVKLCETRRLLEY